MSRNQQIIILIVAIVISLGLVIGAYKKKNPAAFHSGPATIATEPVAPPTTSPTIAELEKPQPKFSAPASTKKPLPKPLVMPAPVNIYKPNPVVEVTTSVRDVIGQMRLLSVSITAAIMRDRMTYGDLEQLDFTGGRDNHGDYAVFNPQGVLMFHGILDKWLDEDTLNDVTTDQGQSIWYTLRREQTQTAMLDVLYAVIPQPNASLCKSTRFHFSLAENLQFAQDNGQVVTDRVGYLPADAQKNASCLFTPDKKAFWFYPLRSRLLRSNSKSWQAAP